MEHTATDTLGNARCVSRIPVAKYEGDTGRADAPMRPRGTVVCFHTDTNKKLQATTIPNSGTNMYAGTATFKNRACGILAESCADTNRRKPRPGRQEVPFVLPITFEGSDIVKMNNPDDTLFHRLDNDILPGDFVYVTANGNITTEEANNLFVGVASVGTTSHSDSVQLRVDTNAPFC